MSKDAEAIVRRWFDEVWNQGREESIDELFAPDAVVYGLGESDVPIRGPEDFKPFYRNMRATFPDLHIDIDNLVRQDDRIALCMDIHGTHQGAGLGIAPTGRRVHVRGMVILQVAGGKIARAQNLWDQLGMLRQIGLVPAPEAEGKDRFFGEAKA
jgi:steroid delta-isomerase-like uncharacterized protein